ncbi:MAG: hypothetical protein U0270_23645 [Labilithrix sp.]
MKALLAAMGSAVLSSLDPGCSATAGANVANGPDGSSYTPVGDTSCGASTHTFCDGFASTGSSLFDGPELFAGKVSTDGGALLATTDLVTQGTRTYARLKKDFSASGSRFTLAYSEKVDGACIKAGDSVETGVIGLRNNSYWVAVRHGKDHDAITEAGLASSSLVQSHVLQEQLPRDRVARVVLDVDLTKKTIDLTVDGRKIVESEPLKEPVAAPQSPRIAVGILTDNLLAPPSPCSVSIDDVSFDMD